jgi:hypothetical protein
VRSILVAIDDAPHGALERIKLNGAFDQYAH